MTIPSKIIFLDIDGPLLSHRAKQHPRNQLPHALRNAPQLPEPIDWDSVKAPKGSEAVRYFDELAVHLLLRLLEGHAAKLVISSSWQKAGLANVRYILEENGIPASFLHPHWNTGLKEAGMTRAQEIDAWLNVAANRGETIIAYAAVDDDSSITTIAGGVFVPYSDGIRWCDFCSASAALGGGIMISDPEIKDGKLLTSIARGPLGETVISAHGVRIRRFDFGFVDGQFSPAPAGCIRLRNSDYQLVRIAEPSPLFDGG